MSLAFIILEKIGSGPKTAGEVATDKAESVALKKLLEDHLVIRTKSINTKTGRPIFVYLITKEGYNTYRNMNRKYFSDVKPKFIN